MDIFISWSGKLSQKIAIELREWLPCVIQSIKPFVSSEDIRKGNRWYSEISEKLDEYNFGIVCLTEENLEAPWLLFESGALSKSLEKSSLFTLLIGKLQPQDVKPPLSSFQHTSTDKEDFLKLLKSINHVLSDKGLDEKTLKKSFNKFWPDLEEKVKHLVENTPLDQDEISERTEKDILYEVLDLTRDIAQNQGSSPSNFIWDKITKSIPEDIVLKSSDGHVLSPNGAEYNHPVAIDVFPIELTDNGSGKLVRLSIKKDVVDIRDLESPPSFRGVSIKILFFSEEDAGFWSVNLRFHKGLTFVDVSNETLSKQQKDNLMGETIWRD